MERCRSWYVLWEIQDRDELENVCKGDVLFHDVTGSYLHFSKRLVACVGLKDTVVVETTDAVLVQDRNRVQDVKAIVKTLERQQREDTSTHKRVYRPWAGTRILMSGRASRPSG